MTPRHGNNTRCDHVQKIQTQRNTLRPGGEADDTYKIDRRDFMRHSFNAAAGLITVSLGSVGFASLLMGTSENDGGTPPLGSGPHRSRRHSVVRNSTSGTDVLLLFCQCRSPIIHRHGWGPRSLVRPPVNVVYVPHEENKNTAVEENKPRFQYLDGYTD